MNHEELDHDYRSSMQRVAFAYLQRHEAQHLVDSDLLYENCVRHMTTALEVPVFMAQKLVHNAWTELQVINQRKWIGVDWGNSPGSTVVHLIDTRADLRYPVPARLLPQTLLAQRDDALKQHPQ
ncbi:MULTISPECIES: hypothetical protein [Pseudomonas]|jgi:hypothetical protein|uniref:Uncharacterized protein n=1 Tax=Pseudomonas hefeiensis TaxID=2738125 RepID=A0ABY9GFP2_9PSED|nr:MULTISPECIES: hypothetical protein [Pseudomonas]EIK64661.1 hypothetical protein PflQ8_1862 [Pseudomonas fluorescens Q8r1-96]MDR8387431.1 hypothetical protein [Pseudomonas sp. JL2]PBJ21181.1 hypothetical protein BSG18_32450 [Pseudomonas ogarae]UVM63274.1 hypothetical protein LOY50_09600 [Pseudomonas sp. B21-010]WLH14479.1 hypothetical protein PSH57_09265 [Pseudomonas sp. FP205]